MTCGNGTTFRTRNCSGDGKNESIEVQYRDCDMGCCPGNYISFNLCFHRCNNTYRIYSYICTHIVW